MLLSAIVYFVMNYFFICLYFRLMNILWETVGVVTFNKYNETGSVTEKQFSGNNTVFYFLIVI